MVVTGMSDWEVALYCLLSFALGVAVTFLFVFVMLWKYAKKELSGVWVYLGPVGWIWWVLRGMPGSDDE